MVGVCFQTCQATTSYYADVRNYVLQRNKQTRTTLSKNNYCAQLATCIYLYVRTSYHSRARARQIAWRVRNRRNSEHYTGKTRNSKLQRECLAGIRTSLRTCLCMFPLWKRRQRGTESSGSGKLLHFFSRVPYQHFCNFPIEMWGEGLKPPKPLPPLSIPCIYTYFLEIVILYLYL